MKSPMKSWTKPFVVLLAVIASGAGGHWLGHRGGAGAAKEDDATTENSNAEMKPMASVGVAPLRRTTISKQATVYGSVAAPANEVRAISVPFECRVTKVFAIPGQTVAAGDPLIEIDGSAATDLLLKEAQNTLAAAERDLQSVKQRYDQKLATNTDLNAVESASLTAQGRMQSLQQTGAGGPRQLKADLPGIVSKVDVQVGQVVATGSPLVELAAQNKIEVKLSVGPLDAQFLKIGQAVSLWRVDDAAGAPIEGKIRVIGARVDPATRLVEVTVSLPPETRLMLDAFVTAKLSLASAEAFVAPRDAVLPDDAGEYALFTVKDGKAIKHAVQIGIENDVETEVSGKDLTEGEPVAVLGNYVLEDGMAVQSYPLPPQPALTTSATEPEGRS